MRGAWLILGWLVFTPQLAADWKITTTERGQCRADVVRTEYFKGDLRRTETALDGVLGVITVTESNQRFITWNSDHKEYVSVALRPSSGVATLVSPPSEQRRSVLYVDIETIDTGERQTLFGHTARHLITTERRFQEEVPGAPKKFETETVRNAWYVDAINLPSEKQAGRGYILVGFAGQPLTVKTSRRGPMPTGMVVREQVTSRNQPHWFGRSFEMEVTELQDGPLSPALFEPPADFRQVDRLADTPSACHPTFDDELETYWNTFENWLFSLF